jgi:hypothetical protein
MSEELREVAESGRITSELVDVREPHSDLEIEARGSVEVCRGREQPVSITKEFTSGLRISIFYFT